MKNLPLVMVLASNLAGASEFYGNIRKGNYGVSGSASVSRWHDTRFKDSHWSVYSVMSGEYFLVDRFALGLDYSIYKSGGTDPNYSLGAHAKYHYFAQDRISSFVGVSASISRFSSSIYNWGAQTGLDYWITPQLHVGPVFYFNQSYYHGKPSYGSSTLSLALGISLD